MKRRVVAAVALVAALVAAEVAFERIGAHAIVDAPNQRTAAAPPEPGEARVGVGPPAATLAVRVVAPATAPRATIFLLHGIRANKEHLRGWAERLRDAGYRAVLVDSRGHGHSTGDWLTYGVQESRDPSTLIDALHLDGPIGVMGVSYGAATAIEWAAREPRVRAAVAVAPFVSLREVVPQYSPSRTRSPTARAPSRSSSSTAPTTTTSPATRASGRRRSTSSLATLNRRRHAYVARR